MALRVMMPSQVPDKMTGCRVPAPIATKIGNPGKDHNLNTDGLNEIAENVRAHLDAKHQAASRRWRWRER